MGDKYQLHIVWLGAHLVLAFELFTGLPTFKILLCKGAAYVLETGFLRSLVALDPHEGSIETILEYIFDLLHVPIEGSITRKFWLVRSATGGL